MEDKKKPRTSSAVKRKYNAKVYSAVTAQVPKGLAAAFREKCKAEGISMAAVLKKAMEDFIAEE